MIDMAKKFCETDMQTPGYLCKYCGLNAGRFAQSDAIECPAKAAKITDRE